MSNNSKLSTRIIKQNMDVLLHFCNLPDELGPNSVTLLKDTEICLFKSLREEVKSCDVGGPNCVLPYSAISFQPLFTKMLSSASDELIGLWSSGAVCTFSPRISVEQFSTHFGQKLPVNRLDRTDANFRISQFANYYWQVVREFGMKDTFDAALRFQLPVEIIKTISLTAQHKIYDFCFGHPDIQRFTLSCDESNLLDIGNAFSDPELSDDVKAAKLSMLRMIKTCRSSAHRYA